MHRAFHALPSLTNRSGELLNAVYGFSTMLFKVINDLNPAYLIVAFDTKETTFRKMEYIGYQSKRPTMDEGLSGQFPYAQKMVEAMGIPIFTKGGFEADDVIGTLAFQATSRAEKRGSNTQNNLPRGKAGAEIDEVVIVTGDRDLYQLINDKVKVYAPVKGLSESKMMGKEEVIEKMGVSPDRIVDFKALTGDGSDNYPGVPGIGPKTAIDLLSEFGSFENIYKAIHEVPNEKLATQKHRNEGGNTEYKISDGIREKLIKGEELGRLSYKLATIIRTVDVDPDWEKCKFNFTADEKENTIKVMKEFGFKSLAARLEGNEKPVTQKHGNEGRNTESESQQKLF